MVYYRYKSRVIFDVHITVVFPLLVTPGSGPTLEHGAGRRR